MQPFGKFESPDFERSKMPVSRDSKAIFAILPGSPISVVSIGFRSIADSGGGGGPPTGAGGGGGGAPVILRSAFYTFEVVEIYSIQRRNEVGYVQEVWAQLFEFFSSPNIEQLAFGQLI